MTFTVKDRARSIRFYEEHFGFKNFFENDVPVPVIEKIVYLKLGDMVLELVHIPTAPTNQGFRQALRPKPGVRT